MGLTHCNQIERILAETPVGAQLNLGLPVIFKTNQALKTQ